MADELKKKSLDVFLYNYYVGKLCFENGVLSFSYDKKYLTQNDAVKLSSSLPLRKEPFDEFITSAYFSGLLPDEYVRVRLARYLGVSEKNTFALLREIGGECAGAVSVHTEGSAPDKNEKSQYRILEDKEASDILSSLDHRPMLAGEEDIRISGAGAQDKLVVAFVDHKMAIPKRNTPSTHIIKPAIKDLEESVQNEFFCMKLAKAIGIPVPEVSIYWLEGYPYYLIKRYDRRIGDDGDVIRLHQEDFCQAMQISPKEKYENEGGPTLIQCFELLDNRIKSGVMGGKDKITFLQGVIFNFLIGNGDAHGKNFSLLYDGKLESLAPFYDLMCTVLYSNSFKAKMAMKIGGKYKFKDVLLRHFEELGKASGITTDLIRKQIHIISADVIKASEQLLTELNKDPKTSSDIYEKIVSVIKKHSQMVSNIC